MSERGPSRFESRAARSRVSKKRLCAAGLRLIAQLGLAGMMVVSGAQVAQAEVTSVRVLVVFEQADDPLLRRVEAELVASGFVTVEHVGAQPLDELARTEQAAAAIRALPSGAGVELWMADATSGRSLLRQVIVDERVGGPDHTLIALQTSELLRTSLLSHSEGPPDPTEGGTPTPSEPTPPKPRSASSPSITVLQLGAGGLYNSGGAGLALPVWVSLQRSLNEHLAVGLDLSVPLKAAELSKAGSSAELRMYSAALGVLVGTAPGRRWFATGGAALALVRLSFEGTASAPLLNSTAGVWTCAGTLRAEAGLEATDWLRAGGALLAGATADQVHVELAGSPAGEWDRGFGAAYAFAGLVWR